MALKFQIPNPKKSWTIKVNKDEAQQYEKRLSQPFKKEELRDGKVKFKKNLNKWEVFEERIRLLLEYCEFEDISSGPSSIFGGYQIDVAGGYQGTFIVVECKSAEELQSKSMKQVLTEFDGKKKKVEEDVKDKFGDKYNEVRYVLAL